MAITKKECTKCGEIKEASEFSKDSSKKDGLYPSCKSCKKVKDKKWINENQDKIKKYQEEYYSDPENIKKRNEYSKKHYEENKERKLKLHKEWRENNKEYHRELINRWYKENPDYHKNYQAKRREEDPEYALLGKLRYSVYDFVKGKSRSKRVEKLVGCKWEFLKQHLESQFVDGMTWDNYGKGGWEIDHIIPCSLFDPFNEHAVSVAFHWSNCQPLWSWENNSKNNQIPDLGIEIDQEWIQNRGIR